MRTFAEFLPTVRQRLRALTGQPEQLTLVFDAGASSRQNLKGLAGYVTALPPSRHVALLSEAADQLTEVALSTGAMVQAWRTRRVIAGEQREIVVLHSPKLHAGQVRGLGQTMARATAEIQELDSDCVRLSLEAVRRRMKTICARQYLRKLLQYEATVDEAGGSRLRAWCNWDEYQRLDRRYFGLRVLISDRAEWSTGEIVAAYRGQSRVEASFRDLKNPGMLAIRPQFHWTDQKLRVHAFVCVMAYLLVTLLHRRAKQRAAFVGGAQGLLTELAAIRCCRMIDRTGKRGRPRVRWQVEETEPGRLALAEALHALPKLN